MSNVISALTNEIVDHKRRRLAVLCGEQFAIWGRGREGDFLLGQVAPIHKGVSEMTEIHSLKWDMTFPG